MKRLAVLLLGLACLWAPAPARAEIGTADAVPAATLLLPYFEVDLGNPSGVNTLFTVSNASATAVVAHVVLWSDWGLPSIGFDLYLTGYDVQPIDLRQVFAGQLPVTADAGTDPTDTISNKGDLSQDINFPGAIGPCGTSRTLYNQPDPGAAIKFQHLNRVHTGQSSPIDGRCWGAAYGDAIARGYVTVDAVTQCSLLTPTDAGYFASIATAQNVLYGDYAIVSSQQNYAIGESLVHIEACRPGGGMPPFFGYVGTGAGHCPLVPGDYSFYGRYVGFDASDQREPLPTTFAARYQGGSKSDLLVWRDTKSTISGNNGPRACGLRPSWAPLGNTEVIGFDNEENSTALCTAPVDGTTCWPLATQRTNVKDGNGLTARIKPPYTAGWLHLNLNHAVSGDLYPDASQAWVVGVRSNAGRFASGSDALPLDNALTTPPGGPTLLP